MKSLITPFYTCKVGVDVDAMDSDISTWYDAAIEIAKQAGAVRSCLGVWHYPGEVKVTPNNPDSPGCVQ